MNAKSMTPMELWRAGLDVLAERLGPDGLARFLGLLESGRGDYTCERHEWLDGLEMDDIVAEMRRKRNRRDGA